MKPPLNKLHTSCNNRFSPSIKDGLKWLLTLGLGLSGAFAALAADCPPPPLGVPLLPVGTPCPQPENKVPLGFVEGLNNKIRVLQRRAYGIRDEQYLRLKVLTCMLPEI